MMAAELALALFAICNALRVMAYLPQIARIWGDSEGAQAISYTTWGLFGISNFSTVGYAVLTLDDWRMAAVFGANTLCCTVILALTAYKRARYRTSGIGLMRR